MRGQRSWTASSGARRIDGCVLTLGATESQSFAIRYSARGDLRVGRRHGIEDEDILHAVEQALAAGEQDDGKALYLGPDRAANLLEVVAVTRDDESEIVIHAMRMRTKYEPFLLGDGGSDA